MDDKENTMTPSSSESDLISSKSLKQKTNERSLYSLSNYS